jgi:hypothetical protein
VASYKVKHLCPVNRTTVRLPDDVIIPMSSPPDGRVVNHREREGNHVKRYGGPTNENAEKNHDHWMLQGREVGRVVGKTDSQIY